MLRRRVACGVALESGATTRRRGLALSFALVLGAACSADTSPSPHVPRDAAIIRRRADASVPDAANAGGDAATVVQRFAAATANLTASQAFTADSGVDELSGTASWRTTSEGVDFEIALRGAARGAAYGLSILDAPDGGGCAQVASSQMDSVLGQGLPVMRGIGVAPSLTTGYSRSAASKAPWTLGGGGPSDLLGRVLVVRDGASGKPLACGVITQAGDVERAPLPPVDRAPTTAVRAAIGGVCLGRQYPDSSPRCPDDTALLRCEAVHCEISSCLQSCEGYASCLEQQADACSVQAASECVVSNDCEQCMQGLRLCANFFCAEDLFCPAAPTSDGPCHELANCGALQGKDGDASLAFLIPFLAGFGGDANCVGNMHDWAVVSQWKAPCQFAQHDLTPVTKPPSTEGPRSEAPLADGDAGKSCKTDAECPGGTCAPVSRQGAASDDAGGYCTRACESRAQCGYGGTCATSQSPEGKQCLAACNVQADCRSGFLCTGAVQGGGIVVPGACRPARQPEQLADHTAGRACQVDADCDGGSCSATNLLGTKYPGNYCTARCYEDAQCGQGGVCLWTRNSDDLGSCLASCSTDADCARKDHGCWEMTDGARLVHACYPRKQPLPDRRAGQPCTLDAECGAPDATCEKQLPCVPLSSNDLIDVPGGYCTQRCSLDSECGEGAQCINYGTSGGLCLASCTSGATCRAGYECFSHFRNLDETSAVCVASF